VGQIPKINSRTEKIQKKISCTTNLLKKKTQELVVIFKIIMSLPPVDELSGKIFLGHLKKNIVQMNVAEKKFLQAIGG
jgi:hypothetical protein